MIKNLGVSFRATKKDELHLTDPNRVDGWSVKHLLISEISVSEINFQERYNCSEHLANDENRDLYPPCFITQLYCQQPTRPPLDVEYMLHIIKGGKIVKNYNFTIVLAKASHDMEAVELAIASFFVIYFMWIWRLLNKKNKSQRSLLLLLLLILLLVVLLILLLLEKWKLLNQNENNCSNKLGKSPMKFAANKSTALGTLEQKPQMRDIVIFVIPKIKASWKNIACVLQYDIQVVKAIGQNHQNVEECCQELFEDWLTTDYGVQPKTWSTLLTHLKKLEELAAAVEAVEEKLKHWLSN